MYIVWGRDLFGNVDRVPGVCLVQTLFPHLMWFPIFPYMTVLVIEGRSADEPAQAVPIRRSWKSVGFAWLRGCSIVVAVIALAGALDLLMNANVGNRPHLPLFGGITLAAALVFVVSFPLSRPSTARREYLLKLVAKFREQEAAESAATAAESAPDATTPKPWHRPAGGSTERRRRT